MPAELVRLVMAAENILGPLFDQVSEQLERRMTGDKLVKVRSKVLVTDLLVLLPVAVSLL
jgi:hypothetical protein